MPVEVDRMRLIRRRLYIHIDVLVGLGQDKSVLVRCPAGGGVATGSGLVRNLLETRIRPVHVERGTAHGPADLCAVDDARDLIIAHVVADRRVDVEIRHQVCRKLVSAGVGVRVSSCCGEAGGVLHRRSPV